MPTTEVNGIAVYYEVAGAGDPLVVVNGLAGDISELGAVTGALSGRRRVLLFDNRGAGRTEKPDEPYSVGLMAEDTAGVMRRAGFVPADVLGFSMGARIALELAHRHPEMVRRLVLVSAAARVTASWRRRLLMGTVPRLPILKGAHPQPYYAFRRQRDASTAYDARSVLGGIGAPVLLLHGRQDRIAPLASAEELHAGLRRSELVSFAGGHLFFLTGARQDFLATVEAWLGGAEVSTG